MRTFPHTVESGLDVHFLQLGINVLYNQKIFPEKCFMMGCDFPTDLIQILYNLFFEVTWLGFEL